MKVIKLSVITLFISISSAFAAQLDTVLVMSQSMDKQIKNIVITPDSYRSGDESFIDGNRALHHELLKKKIPHDYIERPGGHTIDYWENSIKYQLVFFANYF